MKLTLKFHDNLYAVEQLQLALFPEKPDGSAVSALHRGKKWLTAVTEITLDGKTTRAVRRLDAAQETVRLVRRILQQSYYLAALPHLETVPAWGALSGVRPTKLTTAHLLSGGTEKTADRLMEREYFVTPRRRRLAIDCSLATLKAAALAQKQDISLYIGIPFCPTRCSYCSFVSRTVGKHTELMKPYLDALLQEIAFVGKGLKETGHTVRTVYIGGGTPTTLSAPQLKTLLEAIYDSFDLRRCLEFTVEGGRPDTLSPEKFRALRTCGANRMSINPQTMEDGVLRTCGRPHNSEDVVRRYREAVNAGFTDINMDLIAGLPGDTYEGFCRSLSQIVALEPANITVHTLALKRGADLFENQTGLPGVDTVARMTDWAEETLRAAGYQPYYLYRQKYMSGSFENIGWSKHERDCLYNIYMMEELHTILSLGGGGMTKVNLPDGSLRRFPNPKFPEQYLEGFREVLKQKDEVLALLKEV